MGTFSDAQVLHLHVERRKLSSILISRPQVLTCKTLSTTEVSLSRSYQGGICNTETRFKDSSTPTLFGLDNQIFQLNLGPAERDGLGLD